MKLNIATLITLIAVVDHSPYRVLATAKTSDYETETISKQEDDAVSVLPLLRGVKKAVYQFLSDSDSEELSCYSEGHHCHSSDQCCGDMICMEECTNIGLGSDSEELSCFPEDHACHDDDDCCEDMLCVGIGSIGICRC